MSITSPAFVECEFRKASAAPARGGARCCSEPQAFLDGVHRGEFDRDATSNAAVLA